MTNPNEQTALIQTSTGYVRNTNDVRPSKKRIPIIISIAGSLSIMIVIVVCISIELQHDHGSKVPGPINPETIKKFARIAEHEVHNNLNSLKTYASPGCEATILIMRHCEKQSLIDSTDYAQQHCNSLGLQRARYLSTLFGNGEERWPSPSYLYALSPDRKDSTVLRQIETLKPLEDKAKITINTDYGPMDTSRLAHNLFKDVRFGKLCNSLAVISWNHRDIPALAQKLGCGPYNGCPMNYDAVYYDDAWEINFRYKPHQGNFQNGTDVFNGWEVFGSVVKEGFDLLHFSKVERDEL